MASLTQLHFDEEFEAQVSTFFEKRAAEKKAGEYYNWRRCKRSFLLYVILDCTLRIGLKEHIPRSKWIQLLFVKSLLRKRRRECREAFGRSSKEHAKHYAELINGMMTQLNLFPDMLPHAFCMLEKPFDEEFEAELYAFFDERASEQKEGVSFDWMSAERTFLVYVILDISARYWAHPKRASFMMQLHLVGLQGEIKDTCEVKFGRSPVRHSIRYSALIRENMKKLDLLTGTRTCLQLRCMSGNNLL